MTNIYFRLKLPNNIKLTKIICKCIDSPLKVN